MRRATRIVASSLGVFAGIGGPEHGIFEIMRGNVRPESVMIASMRPPCNPEQVWHACEPAMTVIPNFLVTGILATIVGVITMVWAAFFTRRRRGGLVLILLSVALLLVGGGLMPPAIGIIGGVVGTRVNAPVKREATQVSRFLAKLWPWALVAFFTWMLAQFAVGHFFNAFLMRTGYAIPLLIVGLMVLSIVSAFAHDREHKQAV
jgi:hypothetical protein